MLNVKGNTVLKMRLILFRARLSMDTITINIMENELRFWKK